MKLFTYFRSSAAYRVRIALNLKGIEYATEPVSLVEGAHKEEDYLLLNPQGLVPALELDDGRVIAQSMAIMDYLEENFPQVSLLPSEEPARTRVRSIANAIACDIHPLNNLRILKYLKRELGHEQEQVDSWYAHWIQQGFNGIEQELAQHAGLYCEGDNPSLADCCLLPQVYNARRFNVPLDNYPTILRIVEHCNRQQAFIDAHPAQQPDNPEN